MSQDINVTQELEVTISALDYRLDILRLTFKIEELLENGIRAIFKKTKKITEKELITMFINKDIYNEYKKWYKGKDIEAAIWTQKQTGEIIFNIENFISHNTFGGLISLVESMKFDVLKDEYRKLAPKLEFKIFKKWMKYIKDIRNGLAHRTNINPSTFLEKSMYPAQSKALNTKSMSTISLKKFIFTTFLKEKTNDDKVLEILQKYNFLV